MLDSDLLKILCCPETHQELKWAEPLIVEDLNRRIKAGQLKSRAGEPIAAELEGGLVRADGKFLYPVRHGIPIMLVDEAIALS